MLDYALMLLIHAGKTTPSLAVLLSSVSVRVELPGRCSSLIPGVRGVVYIQCGSEVYSMHLDGDLSPVGSVSAGFQLVGIDLNGDPVAWAGQRFDLARTGKPDIYAPEEGTHLVLSVRGPDVVSMVYPATLLISSMARSKPTVIRLPDRPMFERNSFDEATQTLGLVLGRGASFGHELYFYMKSKGLRPIRISRRFELTDGVAVRDDGIMLVTARLRSNSGSLHDADYILLVDGPSGRHVLQMRAKILDGMEGGRIADFGDADHVAVLSAAREIDILEIPSRKPRPRGGRPE